MHARMETTVIPKARQIEAITDGSFMKLLAEFVPDPTVVDIRRFISVTREDLLAHLQQNSLAVRRVLVRARCDPSSHDRLCIENERGKYHLYWLDHGTKRFGEEYESAETVVADYLLKEHGLA